MKKLAIALLALATGWSSLSAQRHTDLLDRGLVAMKVNGGVFLSWRVLAEEYYDVAYHVYRDGVKITNEPLSISNYIDAAGTTTSTYAVAPVVDGQEQAACTALKPWSTSYKEIKLVHEGIKSKLVPNDACCADVDGDGELEILLKYDNKSEAEQSYPKNGPTINGVVTHEHSIMECLKMDGTRLWWVNFGPNMGDFQNNEQNMVAFDWDQDGKAEVVMRACDGTTVHMADGTTYTIGNPSVNVRANTGGGTNWFVITTGEYLLYMDGATGKQLHCAAYPLKLLESGETSVEAAWGDGYGHRASKHFFGAPFLDGRKPSIFLARGIYTRHKMIAYDVDPATHTLKERWRWFNNTNGPWKGQGYHNYCVADVDMDGRDEIVFGSMVIDDNGKGLSTTGLGHGDAEHVGDLNPYVHGLEIYACMEDHPGNNYRDATTSKIYHRYVAGNDDGRAMAGNFTNRFPGGLGCSAREGAISTITGNAVSGLEATGVNTNFRIYWDDDLCEETFNYVNGKNTEGCIAKYGSWSPIYTCTGSMTNNDTKGTPCYQGDLFGDWREEIIMRTGSNNIRIYSTPTPTQWRNYTLWHDHQYRNAMVWQMCGYNQPPRPSYYLGEMEGITIAPPPLTMTGRTEVNNGGTVGSALNGQHVLVCETSNSSISIEDGAQPKVLTFNVPTWVQGTAASESTNQNSRINYVTYTCTVTGGGISGNGRLVKQGDGILTLPKADFTHTGETNVWGGTLNFDGTMKQSPLWLNRHTELNSDGGQFKSIKADYGAVIRPGGADKLGTLTADSLELGFGSRLSADLYSTSIEADMVKVKVMKIERKKGNAWTVAGPEYLMPVIELNGHVADGEQQMASGKYVIAEVDSIDGSVDDLILVGLDAQKRTLLYEDGKLIVEIVGQRDPGSIVWSGAEGNIWDMGDAFNFSIGTEQESTAFVSGDEVTFNDDARVKTVRINEDVYPSKVIVSSATAYNFLGDGAISGTASLVKEGKGTLTISNENTYTGGNIISGGVVSVKSLANSIQPKGNLGGVTIGKNFVLQNGAELRTTAAVTNGSTVYFDSEEGGIINNSADYITEKPMAGTMLTKKGSGKMKLNVSNSALTRLVIVAGNVQCVNANIPARTVEYQGGSLNENTGTSYSVHVPQGKTGSWYLANRSTYTNKVTGDGTLSIYCTTEKGTNYYATRTQVNCNFKDFEGTLKPLSAQDGDVKRFTMNTSSGMPNGTMSIASDVEVQNHGLTFRIGKVTGSGRLGGSCTFSNSETVGANTWQVGNDEDWSTSVRVTSNANFQKMGNGKVTWNGANENSGATTIREGELSLGANGLLGTGKLTVEADAVISCAANSKELQNAATVINGIMQVNATRCATATNDGCTSFHFERGLTINGTIRISTTGKSLQVGDSIRVFTAGSFAGKPTVVSTDDILWDDSRISEGLLFVKAVDSGIHAIISEQTPCNIYDTRGRLVRANAVNTEGLPAGIYVCEGRKFVVK